MTEQQRMTFKVEDARVVFRNFSGKESDFNRPGDRNFTIELPDDVAAQMAADGWHIRELPAREEGDKPVQVIKVGVGYKVRPPKIVVITQSGRTHYTEDMVDMLDWVDIVSVDIIATSYYWEKGSNSGIKAYLQTMYMVINEDDLEATLSKKWEGTDPE